MKRKTIIAAAIGVLCLTATLTAQQPTNDLGFLQALKDYTTAAVNGNTDDAAKLGVPGDAPADERAILELGTVLPKTKVNEENAAQPPLEFRILPNLPDDGRQPMLTQAVCDAIKKDLPVAVTLITEFQGNRFRWCEVGASVGELPFTAEHNGKTYAVVSADPSRVMQSQAGWQFRESESQFHHYVPMERNLHIELDYASAARMRELTKTNLHNRLAIIVDGKIVSAPKIVSEIGDRAQITGNFTKEVWQRLKSVLSAAPPILAPPAEAGPRGGDTYAAASGETMVYYLKFIKAADASGLLQHVYGKDNVTATVDARVNSLIVRGPQELVKEVEALLLKIDSPENAVSTSRPRDQDLPPATGDATVGDLRQRYRQLEQQAASLAVAIRELKSASPVDSQRLGAKAVDLNTIIKQAFETRQQLQRVELEQLRHRFLQIQRQIEVRDQAKDRIIERRIEELTNPELEWQPEVERASDRDMASPQVAPSPAPLSIGPDSEPEDPELTARKETLANLKQLMVAMHTYHSDHKHFPPAVMLGKDGKGTVPHSWRVELLPYLDAKSLYDEYRFDEPWDSERNRQLLQRMPAVFRSPFDVPDSTNASYFGVVATTEQEETEQEETGGEVAGYDEYGAGEYREGRPSADGIRISKYATVFSRPVGASFIEIMDGTSNTIAIVEAKRDVPWTKPEDIPFDPSQPAPTFDRWSPGGFFAGLADGTARFISDANDDKTVRNLFTINDRQTITLVD